jgi:hypothetical protein
LRFEPQRRDLTAQQQAIVDQFATGAKTENATAKGIASSIDAVKPQVQGYIGEAQGVSDRASQDLSTYLSGNVLQGAAARDAAGTKRRLAETLANTTTELDRRKVDAAAGAKYTIGALRSNAAKALESVGGKLSDLANDEGVYVSSRAGALEEAARSRGVTRRGQDLSHQDRVASREAADRRAASRGSGSRSGGKPRLPGGAKPATPAVQNRAMNKITAALGYASKLKKAPTKADRRVIGNTLLAGNKDAGLPSFKDDPIYLTAALDIAYDGHLSKETVKRLHSLGVSVEQLGHPTRSSRSSRPSVSSGALRNFPRITPLRSR